MLVLCLRSKRSNPLIIRVFCLLGVLVSFCYCSFRPLSLFFLDGVCSLYLMSYLVE
ncbi:hypothetical protein GIB67_018471 [Kingdonia uniflora]|uniref:Uncharacterized protein n=1 Tax=Kingdonia uniflora TaxID=39325 RepID=A0A7J7LW91_9MAGN|nr:hypothetical protein GIB67_018471 [Kingdonia uniflora]